MKVIKPQRLSVMQRVIQHQRRATLVIGVMAYVPLQAPRKLMSEAALWKDAHKALANGLVDEGCPKPCGEVLVSGRAYLPQAQDAAQTQRAVMLRLLVKRGDERLIERQLAVLGDRHWQGQRASEPLPFTSLPVDMAHAFGGPDFERNPDGMGIAKRTGADGEEVVPLPNVEDPTALISSPKDRPEPAGWGPLEAALPQRARRMGRRYDNQWLKTRYPAPAEDFDVHFYNMARPSQWLDGYFDGTESFLIEGMHPDGPQQMTLEPLVVRVFAQRRPSAGTTSEEPTSDDAPAPLIELKTRLDTVHLLPEFGSAIVIHRALMEIEEDDADDVTLLMLAAEAPEQPKTIEHYQQALALRADKERGALAMMKDADLLPPAQDGWLPRIDTGGAEGELMRSERRGMANAERGRLRGMDATRAKFAASGYDIGDGLDEPELPDMPEPDDVEGLLTFAQDMKERHAELQADLETRQKEAALEARKVFADAGYDYDAEMKRAEEEGGGPPDFSAERQMVMLHDMARIAHEGGQPMEELERTLLDPAYEQRLIELEKRVRDSYQKFAHLMPAARVPTAAEADMLRVRISLAYEADESLAGQDLTGADLHDLELRGIDLSGTFLERANLSGADLSGANLSGAVLSRADLEGTVLVDADLTQANLGGTKLVRTDLSGAILDEAVFMRSELIDVRLHGAQFRETNFFETVFDDADFSHARLDTPVFMKSDLRTVTFTGVEMINARFIDVDVRGVDFTGARLDQAQFLKCNGDGAVFAGSSLQSAVFVYETSFEKCSFAGANLQRANFRKTPLSESDFEGAQLSEADLSGCLLRDANLHRVVAHRLMAVRTDFSRADVRGADMLAAVLQKSLWFGADFTGANLSRADLALIRVDSATKVEDALMLDTKVDPQYQEPA